MPRNRDLDVPETSERLRSLERSASGDAKLRVKMLRLFRESPALSLQKVADALGVSLSTIKRWTALYRRNGLDGLLMSGRNGALHPDEPRSGTAAGHTPRHDAQSSQVYEDRVVVHQRIGAWLLRFLESIPYRVTTRQWADMLRTSLAEFLDVDRVSVAMNMTAFHERDSETPAALSIAESAEGGTSKKATVSVTAVPDAGERDRQMIATMVKGGLKLDLFRVPYIQHYELPDGTYLGTIVFLRESHRKPINDETKHMIDAMHDVIVRLLLDCSARHEANQTDTRKFYNVLRRIVVDFGLTKTEQRCITLLLLGNRRKEIATDLETTVDNVAKHLSSIYKKTGTDSVHGLTALLFGPRT